MSGVWQYKELSSSYGNRPKHEIPKRFLKAWGLAVEEADNYSEQDNSEKRTDMLIEKLTRAQEASAEGKEEKQILTACVFESHTFLLNKRSLEMVENRLAALSSKNKKLKMSIEKFKMSPSEAESLKQLSLDPENIVHITAIGNEEQQTKESEVAKIKTEADVEVNGPESTLKRSRLENAINSNRSRQSLSPVKKRLKLQNSDQLKEILIDTAVVDAIQKNGYKLKAVLKDHRKVLESVLDEFLNAKTVKKTNETSSQIVKRKAKQLLTLAEAARFLGESGQSPIKRSLDKIERQLQKERELRGETENAGPSALAKTIPVLPPEPPKPVEIVDPLKPLYSDPLLKEKVCIKCETDEKHLIGCIQCCDAYHVKCLDEDVAKAIDPKVGFTCSKCISGEKHCFSCKESLVINADDESNIFNCTISNCRKFYHTKCLEKYPGLKDLTSPEKVKNTCPQHFCASCYPNDTADNKVCYHGKIIRCLKCPVAYHSKSEDRCFPAGSVILNGHNLICPLHFPSKRSNKIRVNLNWCFFCGIGGDLILCETCPAAFHLQCAKLEEKPSDGRPWSCENCSAGLLPRYNDIVWVKCGAYRWWPARIVDPEEIPDNILRQFHEDGNFVVQFFGSHDYMWTGVGRVFLYEENDKANKDSKSSSLSQNFVKGLTEASEAFQELTIQRRENFSLKLSKSQNTNKPAPYKYVTHNIPQGDVKVMKADLETYEVCRCQKTDPDPCGLSSGCENRMTFIECHPKLCHAGEKCQNQKFAKAEYAETYYFKCGDRGWGLKNKHHLDAGQFVNEYCGDLIDYDEYNRRLKKQNERGELDFYFCFLDSKRVIDAKPKGCHSRFMNHSCDPNCEGRLWTVNGDIRVGLFARHDIPPDTELTFNYNLDSIG